MKKMIAMLLAMALLLSAAPFAVFAAEEESGSGLQYADLAGQCAEPADLSDELTVVTDAFSQDASGAQVTNESEPNDEPNKADALKYHDIIQGKLGGEDVDVFVLKVTEESWICVDFYTDKEEVICALLDANEEIITGGFPARATSDGFEGSLRYYAAPGTYYVTMLANPEYSSAKYQFQVKKNMVYRVFGSTRYDTSIQIANQFKLESNQTKFYAIVVACGTNFPDALAGTYLAAQRNAPILLTNGNNISQINAYITENLQLGGTVYLLGGKNAVPDGIGEGFHVIRLGGATRYETNLEILKEAGVAGKDILVCTGTGFADSLSASATGMPILLVQNGLSVAQKELLATCSGNIYIIGGTSAVSTKVENALKACGNVTRIGGSTRFETSVKVAETFFGTTPYAAVLAYAQNFPDGLCGGPLAYTLRAPLILTMTGKEAAATAYIKAYDIQHGYVLGGTGLISDGAARKIFSLDSNYVIE